MTVSAISLVEFVRIVLCSFFPLPLGAPDGRVPRGVRVRSVESSRTRKRKGREGRREKEIKDGGKIRERKEKKERKGRKGRIGKKERKARTISILATNKKMNTNNKYLMWVSSKLYASFPFLASFSFCL